MFIYSLFFCVIKQEYINIIIWTVSDLWEMDLVSLPRQGKIDRYIFIQLSFVWLLKAPKKFTEHSGELWVLWPQCYKQWSTQQLNTNWSSIHKYWLQQLNNLMGVVERFCNHRIDNKSDVLVSEIIEWLVSVKTTFSKLIKTKLTLNPFISLWTMPC